MLASAILILFILITNSMKKSGITMAKEGKAQGLFIILVAKMLFWFALIEVFYVWWQEALFYILPISIILFSMYLFMDRAFFIKTLKNKASKQKQ